MFLLLRGRHSQNIKTMPTMACACRRRFLRLIQNVPKLLSPSNSRQFSDKKDDLTGKSIKPQTLEPAVQAPTSNASVKMPSALEMNSGENVSATSDSAAGNLQEVYLGKSVTVDARRVDPATVRQVYYFDSLSFVKNLEKKGFSREQAEGMVEAWTEVINTTLDHQSRHMITKKQQEITVQQLMAEIVSVKKDMVLLQKSEFSQLRSETEKMGIELDNLKKTLKDEISKLKGHVTLDINLERGRAVEAHAQNTSQLQQLSNKIDTDIANLKTVFEQYRNDVLKYAGGTVLTCATVCLGVIRLWN